MARVIDSVIGHQDEIQKLFQLKQKGRWPHAIMLVGPSGIGKKKIALGMAQVLVCENSSDGCGQCGACLRIEKLQSESLNVIEPDAELARPVIKVEKIRSLLDSLALANLATARVVIIDQAHLMNPQASNALLKTLEEPTDNVFFILLAPDIHQFLPTIRSRSQVMRFHALSYDQLKQVKPQQPDWAYRACRGRVDLLTSLVSRDGAEKRDESLTFLEQFLTDEEFLLDKGWRDIVKDRAWAIFCVNCWMQLIRDAIVLKVQANQFILNTDQSERLKQFFTLSESKLNWLGEQLVRVERDINANADTALAFEDLWVRYARVD